MTEPTAVPVEVLQRLRQVCLALPEVREEGAWVGTRWRVGDRTFAHVLVIDGGWPPAYARAVAQDGPALVLMVRSSGPELVALRASGPPFFAPPWRSDEIGLVLGHRTDWSEIRELVTESYCTMAPKRLADRVERPDA